MDSSSAPLSAVDTTGLTGYADSSLFPEGPSPSSPVYVVTNPFLVYRLLRAATSLPLTGLIGALDATPVHPWSGVFTGTVSPTKEIGHELHPNLISMRVDIQREGVLLDTESLIQTARVTARKYRAERHHPLFPPSHPHIHSPSPLSSLVENGLERYGEHAPPPVILSEAERAAFVRAHPWIEQLGLSALARDEVIRFMGDGHLFEHLRTLSSEVWAGLSEANPSLAQQSRASQVNPSTWLKPLRAYLCRKPTPALAYVLPPGAATRSFLTTLLQTHLDRIAEEP